MLKRMTITLLAHRPMYSISPSSSVLLSNVVRNSLFLPIGGEQLGIGRGSHLNVFEGSRRLFLSQRNASSTSREGLADVMRVKEALESETGIGKDEALDCVREEDHEASKHKAKLEGGLYLVATPIGNLEDMTFRAVRVLKSAEVILAEDTRHSARLLQHYNITTPMMSYHKFNEFARRDAIIQRLKLGGILALISDAGMPGISDPGTELVKACVESNVRVHPVPGASAVITALVASGLPTEVFTFVGFLPTQATSRRKILASASKQTATQIFYVSPHKLNKTLDDCVSAFGPSRHCVVAREMTKFHEEFWRGTLQQARKEFEERNPRGEMTLVIEGLSESAADELPTEEDVKAELRALLDSGVSPSEASRQVVEGTGMRRKMVYALALKLSKTE
ncbi:uncharacterized protein [Physcomitrium patens]|uniref:Tetrapyrrole methylase domain-containing protein n=1 Tax=Physcomitrium patens TaxID=3218 RepID=A0A2K1IIP4_PHYPA|nr:uncharacterized protein LOC112275546 [Physcomitrium patens]XP_024361768.1 uncharacterized protein LOC112275546 [Physcomitrium patens]PNR29147.1 hypothetical protein PHYPA_027839 [Physcomitrium patens]|eukprot:XP_024361767.1 uncharacterized protein LOC112275546 [Physcomitrella patens]